MKKIKTANKNIEQMIATIMCALAVFSYGMCS